MKAELEKIRDSEAEEYSRCGSSEGETYPDVALHFKMGFDACFKVLSEEIEKLNNEIFAARNLTSLSSGISSALEEENAKLSEELADAKQHVSEACAGREHWMNTHRENAKLKEEIIYSKKLVNAAMEQINMRDMTIVDLDKQVSDFREALEFIGCVGHRAKREACDCRRCQALTKYPQEEKE